MTQFEIDSQCKMLENQQNIVNAIKDLVVVQGMIVKANGLARLGPSEILDLEHIIQRNLK